jgi:3,4-dihydroxy 2-butanone 4-phosphate synthase / GTP cyclohydrolase II
MISGATETFQFDAIDDVLSDIAKGRMVVVTDDADRENEGDLVMAAEKVTPEAVNFMATHGRGLICVPIPNERADQLGLQRMVAQNRERHNTDFTVSVDAARGVTTGISAYAARRSHRGGRGSGKIGRTPSGGRAVRNFA